MATTTTINIQLGSAFWLLIALLIVGGVLWSLLGSERLSSTIRGGFQDTFGR